MGDPDHHSQGHVSDETLWGAMKKLNKRHRALTL